MHLGGLGDDVGAESHLDAAGRGAADRHVEEDHRVGHCCGGEAEGQSWRRRAGSSHTACCTITQVAAGLFSVRFAYSQHNIRGGRGIRSD